MTTRADLKKPVHPPGMLVDVIPPKPPRVPWTERVAAYDRVKPRLEHIVQQGDARTWPREKWIAHWLKIRDDANAAPWARKIAADALQNLGYYPPPTPRSREPGEDDDHPETAWTEPADGAAGDITKRARADALPLGIAQDDLETEFGGVRTPQAAS